METHLLATNYISNIRTYVRRNQFSTKRSTRNVLIMMRVNSVTPNVN